MLGNEVVWNGNNMYLNVVFLPFLSALISGLFGKNLGFKGSGIITTFSISLTFLFRY